jgi:hypothetical protein
MSLENWGGMTKAQDDSQTIDEAISAAITAHEEDPESHMGAGESIENHRINEVIDHPASSLVADKLSSQQKMFFSAFESLDAWSKSATGVSIYFPGVTLQTGSTINTEKYLSSEPLFTDAFNYAKKPFFQIMAGWNNSANVTIDIFVGTTLSGDNFDGFGFRLLDGEFFACYYRDSTLYTHEIDLPSPGVLHILRANIDETGENIQFWVDGVLAYTVAIPAGASDSPELFGFSIKNTAASNRILNLGQLIFASDI